MKWVYEKEKVLHPKKKTLTGLFFLRKGSEKIFI